MLSSNASIPMKEIGPIKIIGKEIQEELVRQHEWKLIAEKIRATSIADMSHRHWLYQKSPC